MGNRRLDHTILARLDIYKNHDWKNAKGEEIKFREQWEQINKELQGKTLCCQCGTHEFTDWLQTEMRRREQGEKTCLINLENLTIMKK